MSFETVAEMVPGGAAALQEILESPQLKAMAQSAGVDLKDPKYLNVLMGQVKTKMQDLSRSSSSAASVVRVPGQTMYKRSAVAHYRHVAAMV